MPCHAPLPSGPLVIYIMSTQSCWLIVINLLKCLPEADAAQQPTFAFSISKNPTDFLSLALSNFFVMFAKGKRDEEWAPLGQFNKFHKLFMFSLDCNCVVSVRVCWLTFSSVALTWELGALFAFEVEHSDTLGAHYVSTATTLTTVECLEPCWADEIKQRKIKNIFHIIITESFLTLVYLNKYFWSVFFFIRCKQKTTTWEALSRSNCQWQSSIDVAYGYSFKLRASRFLPSYQLLSLALSAYIIKNLYTKYYS